MGQGLGQVNITMTLKKEFGDAPLVTDIRSCTIHMHTHTASQLEVHSPPAFCTMFLPSPCDRSQLPPSGVERHP